MALSWIRGFFTGTRHASGGSLSSFESTVESVRDIPDRLSQTIFDEYIGLLDHGFAEAVYGAQPIVPEKLSEHAPGIKEACRYVIQAACNLDRLPRRPNSLPMVMKLLKLEKLSYANISEVLLNDPALTSQVLKTANSPFFRVNNKTIESLDQAIFLLGTNGIKKVVAAAIMKPVFNNDNNGNNVSEGVWRWALACGQLLEALSRKRSAETTSVYLLGLLPALSFLLINQTLDELDASRGLKTSPSCRLIVFRKCAFVVSQRIREQWGLPESYDQHLEALRGCDRLGEDSLLLDAMHVAEYACADANDSLRLNAQQLAALTHMSKEDNTKLLGNLKLA